MKLLKVLIAKNVRSVMYSLSPAFYPGLNL